MENLKKRSVSFLLIFFLSLSLGLMFNGCQVIEALQPTKTVFVTETPALRLEMIPPIPTLPMERATATAKAEDRVHFMQDSSIFASLNKEVIPARNNQKVQFFAVVYDPEKEARATAEAEIANAQDASSSSYTLGYGNQSAAPGQFFVRHKSGAEYLVSCDDYCFYTDDQKKLIPADAIEKGETIAIFGVTGIEKTNLINADLIAIGTKRAETRHKPESPDISKKMPLNLEYQEWALKEAPSVAPLQLTPQEESLEENLKNRLKMQLSERTYYSYGLYGEKYSTSTEYLSDSNRDPNYPTRIKMLVESNDYPFFEFWFPYATNPMFMNWGLLSYGGDWFLPVRMSVDINLDPYVSEIVYADRTLMSQLNFDKTNEYLRSFGFSVIDHVLFYLYEKVDGFGISLNRIDYDLSFDDIPFGLIGKYEELNPFYSDDLITFFGRRNHVWYYVELRINKKYYGIYE